jgi:hypothetical protein
MPIILKDEMGNSLVYTPNKNRVYKNTESRFLRNTLIALDYLYYNDLMEVVYFRNKENEKKVDIIDELVDNARENIFIIASNKNQYFPATNTITFNDTHGVLFRKNFRKRFTGSNVGFNAPVSLLAHEMIHCYHELFDENGYRKRKANKTTRGKKVLENGKDLSYPNAEEFLTVTLTNQINEKLGDDKRGNYGRQYYPVIDVLSTEKKV